MTPHCHPDSDVDESGFDPSEIYFSDASESETDASSASEYGADAASYKDRGQEGEVGEEDEDDEDEDGIGRWLRNEEEQRPPEYYLQEEASLDPSTLRSRRYSPNTQLRLDWAREHWERYCMFMSRDYRHEYDILSIQSVKGFLSWVCDQRWGKDGRVRPGIRCKSSLETFWKWYMLVYKVEAGRRVDDMIKRNAQDVISLLVVEKGLSTEKREKATMYVQDLAELLRVQLATTYTLFLIGWLRIQIILYCQLAGFTSNRPTALLMLRYRDLALTLVLDPESGRPRLVIEVGAEFTKKYLGLKDKCEPRVFLQGIPPIANQSVRITFPIPEVIFDPTLILSPHVFLLGMLFHIQAFKSPSIRRPEDLYNIGIPNGLLEQKLPLKDHVLDWFVFCDAVEDGDGVRLIHTKRLTGGQVRYRLKLVGEITGFEQVVKPYVLRNGAAKAYNASPDVTDSLQCMMLQHRSTDTYIKHYQDRNVTVDVLSIYRGLKPQKALMAVLCSMSRSIDPRQPWKLTTAQSSSVNKIKHIRGLIRERNRIKKERDRLPSGKEFAELDLQHHEANRKLRNARQRARLRLKRQILKEYRREQPVIDSERQLSGQVVDEEVKSALERNGYVTPKHMELIDSVLTLPETTWERETQRRIKAIHAITAYCGVFEASARGRRCAPPVESVQLEVNIQVSVSAQVVQQPPSVSPLERAIREINTAKRPKICFICLGNGAIKKFGEVGDLTKHFQRVHLDKFRRMACKICNVPLETVVELLIHAEQAHGTVTRAAKYRTLCGR